MMNNLRMPIRALILTVETMVGYQIALLLEAHGWRIRVVNDEFAAYQAVYRRDIDIIISDIGSWKAGGLAVMVWCKRHCPWVVPYAICRRDQWKLMQIARDYGGCEGYFYLTDDESPLLDTNHGMTARFLGRSATNERAMQIH